MTTAGQRSGYSGKPLYQKLGIKQDSFVRLVNVPEPYLNWLEAPFSLKSPGEDEKADVLHIFSDSRELLADCLQSGVSEIQQNGMIWVSWPKKASKVPTDVTEDTIRELAFPLDLVDVKVCSVSDVWSGLKLVIRKEKRKS